MEKQRDKNRVKTKIKKAKKSERYLSLALKTFGLLFLIIAGYYFFNSLESDFFSTLMGFLKSSDDTVRVYGSSENFPPEIFINLFAFNFPGILGVILALRYSTKYPQRAYRFTIATIVLMGLINLIVCFYWIYFCGFF